MTCDYKVQKVKAASHLHNSPLLRKGQHSAEPPLPLSKERQLHSRSSAQHPRAASYLKTVAPMYQQQLLARSHSAMAVHIMLIVHAEAL